MTDNDVDARQELERYANAQGQPNQPRGHALVRPTTGIAERVIGAQPVAVHRDEAKILQKLSALAAAAGSDWFYRFPVRSKDGQQWIEGPSVKLANDVARIFGNDVIEVREIDVGDAWVFYSRFTDIETGFSYERAYRQRKSQTSMRTRDADRQQDIAYQIGQSKSIRNVIVNALQIYADHAFNEARNSLVDKIGKDLARWRDRTIDGLARLPVELNRVERVIGRNAAAWLAPDIARVIAMAKAVNDGMSSVDETFPPIPAAEEAPQKPADKPAAPSTTAEPPASAADPKSGTQTEQRGNGNKSGTSGTQGEQPAAKAPAKPPQNLAEYLALVADRCAAATDPEALRAWFVSDQQRKIRNGAGMTAADTALARPLIDEACERLGGPQ